ncbi:hypothetical protein FACS189483_04660 [Spirochaetia bacterium]|nr:hypothetical protein FACS189483_04660 [Spirochaetia bacterium]
MDKLDDLPPWVITTAKWFGFDPERTMARAKTRKQMNYDELFANVNSISTPFGFDQNMYRYLKESKKLVPLYYTSIGYSGSVNGVDRNLIDLKEKEPKYLLLPQDWGKINLLSDYRDMINILFCTYYPALQKRNGNVIYDPLIEYIRANYEFDKDIETYALYKKK